MVCWGDGLASHPEGSGDTPCPFIEKLKKLETDKLRASWAKKALFLLVSVIGKDSFFGPVPLYPTLLSLNNKKTQYKNNTKRGERKALYEHNTVTVYPTCAC